MARSSDQTNGQNSGGIPPLRGCISRSSRSAPHPGAFLESRFLEPLGISQAELAQAIGRLPAPHQRAHRRQTLDFNRHGDSLIPILPYRSRILALSANALGHSSGA